MAAIAGWAARHARVALVVSVVLAVAACVGAMRLSTDAGADTLVDSDTAAYRATEEVREAFGEDPVGVLAAGDLQELILTENLARLLRLEGCLSGKVPRGAEPIPGPCAELARLDPVESVAGPGTFLNEAVIQIDRQLRRLASRVPPERLREILLSVAARYGITSAPSLANPDFIATVVFDLRRSRGTPKARLSYLFPNDRSAQIVIRLRSGLGDAERERALELIRAAVLDPTPRQACAVEGRPSPCFELRGGRYVVSGAPIVAGGVADSLKEALLILFAVAVVAMALTLLLVFRSRMRLLPLALALAAAALAFGLLWATGGSLTVASIAVLPILIGLAVDYAIQFQARFDEAVDNGWRGADAARVAAARGGPAIATACLATAAGFLALQLSPTPMVRDFGLLLVVGVGIAFALALTAGFAALSLRRGDLLSHTASKSPRVMVEWRNRVGAWVGRVSRRSLDLSLAQPDRVLAIAVALAVLGWAAGTQVGTVSDIRELGPQGSREIRDLNELQETTGVSGELDVSVTSDRLTDPATIEWMASFKRRVLEAGGFSGPNPSCLAAEICPGPALSDLLADRRGETTRRRIRSLLAVLPDYDLRRLAEVGPNGEIGDTALLAFGIRAQSLEGQQALIERVREEIGVPGSPGGPPPDVDVQPAGLPVIAAQSASDLSESRYWLTLAGLIAVATVLLAVYRSFRRAFVPLVPIVLAVGWAGLLLWAVGIPLNPMSAALGALVIAIATEFSVILSARFHEEREAGRPVEAALRRAYARTGAAVLASGATATVGFAVLVASDVRMLRDFGFVTVIDLAVALLGVMVVLPAVLIRTEGR